MFDCRGSLNYAKPRVLARVCRPRYTWLGPGVIFAAKAANVSIHEVTQGNLPGILKLDQHAVPQVSLADVDAPSGFDQKAAYFRVFQVDGRLVGLLFIAVPQNS